MFTKTYYQRRDNEKIMAYLVRILVGLTVVFVVIGIPLMALIGHLKGRPVPEFLLRYAPAHYIGMIIGAPIGLLLRDALRKNKT